MTRQAAVQTSPALLQELLRAGVVPNDDWDALPDEQRVALGRCDRSAALLPALEKQGLLTPFQVERISAGKTHGLVLGNYRLLSQLGKGGMGEVFKAEQIVMRKPAAVKVLTEGFDPAPDDLRLFHAEMRAVGRLNHPNIVAAFDAGVSAGAGPHAPVLHYLIMEYVPGENLEQYVKARGPLPVPLACDVIVQVAAALGEAFKHCLVHRDIKPPNIVITPEGAAKLLDFGIVRSTTETAVDNGVAVGTLGYMAPEQVQDAASVDTRADIFALGGTLYWCLTGKPPFPSAGNMMRDLMDRISRQAPSVRAARPDIPKALEAVIARMLAFKAEERYATPQAVVQALRPFAQLDLRSRFAGGDDKTIPNRRVLIVDDDPDNRLLCRFALAEDGFVCEDAEDGAAGLATASSLRPDLILLDIDMPGMSGDQVLRRLREQAPVPHLKIVMMSAAVSSDDLSQLLAAGADDYLTKPLSIVQLQARARAALRLKAAQERGDQLNHRMVAGMAERDRAGAGTPAGSLTALVQTVAELMGQRTGASSVRLRRLQRYARCLAEAPVLAGRINSEVIALLDRAVPLHDIGTLALPDHILLHPGKYTDAERRLMQDHTVQGARTLLRVSQLAGALVFPPAVLEVARHHHERFDGKGYPDRLAGADIPLAARIAAIADVYDALRSRRSHRPAFAHPVAVRIMVEGSVGQFDPQLLRCFQSVAAQFERIFRETKDE